MAPALPNPVAPAASASKSIISPPTGDNAKSPEKGANPVTAKGCISHDISKSICSSLSQSDCLKNINTPQPVCGNSMLPSVVSAVLVVIGWFVVHKAQSNRERRKQIRDYVSDLCDDLAELEKMAVEYHTTDRDKAKEQEIISKLSRLEKSCSTLPRFIESQKFKFKAVDPKILKIDGKRMQVLRQSMSLDHFGDEHTGALGHQDDLVLYLQLAAEELHEALEGVRIGALD